MQRVLVIDDDDLSRAVLSLLLVEEGYGVEVARSGEVALEMLADGRTGLGDADVAEGNLVQGEGHPDVVLMDMQMPGLCGDDLARELRERCGGSMTLVAMSGSPLGGVPGAWDAFLLKPFSMEEFAGALGGRGARRGEVATGQTIAAGEVLDGKIFAGFEALVGSERLCELYEHCLQDAAAQLGEMRRAAAESDGARLRKCAHAMKGSLGMVGARELEGMCSELEKNGLNATTFGSFAKFGDALGRLRGMLVARGVDVYRSY